MAGAGQCAGIWGLDGITIDGDVVTDSYVTSAGSYGAGNIRPNGDVCSCRDIVTNGGITVRGDAMYGEGYDFTPYGSSYEVTGLIDDHRCDLPDLSIDWEAVEATNDNADIPNTYRNRSPYRGFGHLYVTGNDHLTLPPGTFYFSSALVDGQAYIEVTGPTTMYIEGNATLTGGGVINITQDPHNLTIYAYGPLVDMTGGAAFYGSLIAPTATVHTHGDYEGYEWCWLKSWTVTETFNGTWKSHSFSTFSGCIRSNRSLSNNDKV